MSAVLCPHCGKPHRDGAKFCPTTGKLMAAAQPVSQAPLEASLQAAVPAQAGLTGRLLANSFLRNRYLIVRKIGQGGMAAVYHATDVTQPGTQWAIKEMSDAALANPQDRDFAVQAFQQEANLLQMLNHANLPKVIDAFTEGGKHYLVMEFVPGQTLQVMLEKRSQPFSEGEVISWAVQLCDVLGYLHNQNPKIIFRDIKPSNIMLTPQGQIKLIDFGIVRFFKPWKARDTIALGTPGYAAPEAAAGQTDERSDIYSLCVTLHQLLSMHEPIRTMFNLPPVRQLNLLVSTEFERILVHGLQNQRELRWANVDEMRVALVNLQRGAVVPHRVPTSPPVVTPGLGRAVAAPAVMPADAPGVARAQAGYGSSPPVSPTMIAPRPTSRPTTRLLMVATQVSGRQLLVLAVVAMVVLVAGTFLLSPLLKEAPVNWNNVPIVAVFGALGYAAYPKRGAAFTSHVLLSIILVVTIWLRLGSQGYSWGSLFLGALVSGAFMELWVAFLPKVKGSQGSEAWVRELSWMAVMAVVGTILFLGLVTDWVTGLNPWQWLVSAGLGAAGWFLGDLLQQYLLHRQTGLPRMK